MFFRKTEETRPEPTADDPLRDLKQKIEAAGLPERAAKVAAAELERLRKTDPSAAEYAVGLNYLEFMLDLPWTRHTFDTLDMARAEQCLEAGHFGLGLVKERILEFLAAKTLSSLKARRILIVDDEDIARANLEHIFRKEGHKVDGAANGIEAVKLLSTGTYDVALTDLKMEGMDGLELLAHIREHAPETQVVLITGYATVNTAVESLKKGAAHYLCKPINLDELRRVVREILDQKRYMHMAKGPILCFAGPPGTGKTSIGRAIAEALGRTFVRFSMAGLRDEAEIRGHRRTYVGAMPGRILNELKRAEVMNPVVMLDEIDKIGQDFRGDPASVLLEVLDPEQNAHFVDHYLDIPFDLSRVMFIATANNIERLPGPLRDRMEIITFPSYSEAEKLVIAQRYLIPRQIKENGLDPLTVRFTDEAVLKLISDYTRESGLRSLEREAASVCRKVARLSLAATEGQGPKRIDADMVAALLGPRTFIREAAEEKSRVGVTTGLVWSEFGGEIIFVETARMKGKEQLILTGSLGDVLRESAQTALSYARSHASQLGAADDFFENHDIHIHIPAGAISKDGPSAGVTIAMALASLVTGRPARPHVAMTGELTLSGRILPVAGIREKLLAARRAGVTTVILPKRNAQAVEALDQDVKQGLTLILADDITEIVDVVLE